MEKSTIYLFFHLVSIFGLTGITFYAFASPKPENKKMVSILAGVFALIALVTGFGLLHVYNMSFSGWLVVKIFCWFGVAALSAMVFSKSDKARIFTIISVVLIFLALFMVTFKPF